MWLPQSNQDELLDGGSHDSEELAANLHDIARINRYFGGTQIVLQHMRSFLAPGMQHISILDIGTGIGDIPLAVYDLCSRQGIQAQIVCIDKSAAVLRAAQAYTNGHRAIRFEEADAFHLPYKRGSFDVVLCSLAFHHFGWEGSVKLLERMADLAQRGFIVNDLVRSRLGYTGAWLITRLITRNRYTRHDAPLSVLRAFTPAEYRAMVRAAGLSRVRLYDHLFFRTAIVGRTLL